MLNRRGFLGSLGAVFAGATLDPERALWVPDAKTISIPRPRVKRFVRVVKAYPDGRLALFGDGDMGIGRCPPREHYELVDVDSLLGPAGKKLGPAGKKLGPVIAKSADGTTLIYSHVVSNA